MTELVSAIANLCKLLNCLVNISLKPDIFRLAKLNKLQPEQIIQIWDTAHKLCCFSLDGRPCSSEPYKCVENFLRRQGGVAAYFLSPDVTARQLLLSLGFILSERIIESNIQKVLIATPLGEELPSFMVESDEEEMLKHVAIPDDPQAMLDYILFVTGKIKHNLKAVANYREEKAKLFSKVHQASACGFNAHSSVGDLVMTRKPGLQAEFLSRCQHCIPLLQAYSKWHRKRHIFWEWMMTVIEEEFKEKPKQHSLEEITHLHEFLRKLKSDVHKSQENDVKNGFETSNVPTATRRMCLNKNGEILDSAIENLNLQINTLEMHNKTLVEEIQMNLIKGDTKSSSISSILETFCGVKGVKTEILNTTDIEIPVFDNLKIT